MGEMRFGPGMCGKCGRVSHGGECKPPSNTFNFGTRETVNQIEVYRDIFNEITAKAVPFLTDPNDEGRILSYVIPCGPLHRAAGNAGHQMFDGERHLAAAIERIAELEKQLRERPTPKDAPNG